MGNLMWSSSQAVPSFRLTTPGKRLDDAKRKHAERSLAK